MSDEPRPIGRPSLFGDIDMEQVRELAIAGKTDAELAKALGITRTTLADWKKRHPEFGAALQGWKDEADDAVELTLYQKALAGDTTACIFWLKNRRAKQWRDKVEHEHNASADLAALIAGRRQRVAALDKEPEVGVHG